MQIYNENIWSQTIEILDIGKCVKKFFTWMLIIYESSF